MCTRMCIFEDIYFTSQKRNISITSTMKEVILTWFRFGWLDHLMEILVLSELRTPSNEKYLHLHDDN